MEIKLIAADIDGTLIDRSEQIPDELCRMIEACRKQGIHFAAATGRTKELALPVIRRLGITDPCVLSNGACIQQGDQCLKEHAFSVLPIVGFLRQADYDGLTVTLTNAGGERALRCTDYVREHQKFGNRFRSLIDLDRINWQKERFQKVMIMDERRSGKIVAYQKALAKVRDQYWVTTYSNAAVELGPKGCNKATGVKELAQLLGIGMQNVMTCGDFLNDLEMIQEAGVGVAVGNADESLKKAADYVAEAPLAYGVIEAIKKYCFPSRTGDI